LVGLRKEFPGHDGGDVVVAVDDVSLEVEKGAMLTLLGPSGCGKTTLLRLIAGFEEPTRGEIHFGDRRVDGLAPNVRDTAMVFQSYAIFPHLDVFENVAFGLRMARVPEARVRERVGEVLELVGLAGLERRAPSQLSGGQQQRVALARCIVLEPQVLLFDEPLSNLDAKLREQMRIEVRELQQRLGVTSVYVTHDQAEAMALSDLVVVMNRGRIVQVAPPRELYSRPNSRFVADFIGKANFLTGEVVDARTVDVAGARLPLSSDAPVGPGRRVELVVRPEAVALRRDGPGARGRIARAAFLGDHAEYHVTLPSGDTVVAHEANPAERGMFAVGEEVTVTTGPLHPLPPAPAP
jgi:iron(III) transport system ATP-binding protein